MFSENKIGQTGKNETSNKVIWELKKWSLVFGNMVVTGDWVRVNE